MMVPNRKPITPGYVLKTEFLEEMELSQQAAAELMGVSRKTVNELVNNKQSFTVDISLIMEKVFGTPPDFWLNLQRQLDLWLAHNNKRTQARVAKATPYQVSRSPKTGRMVTRKKAASSRRKSAA